MITRRKQYDQSREWIINALLDLIEIKQYKKITISDISRQADLTRRTFYRHFMSIDDVVDEYFKLKSIEFNENLSQNKILDFNTMVHYFFSFWEKKKSVLQNFDENNLLFKQMSNFFNINDFNICDLKESDYNFIIGGVWNLFVSWINEGAIITPREMMILVESKLNRNFYVKSECIFEKKVVS